VLLHPTSLPGAESGGELGRDAYYFVDWMVGSGLSVWQMLPLGPTHEDRSPYQCLSAHAGSPALISLERLAHVGWLDGSQEATASRAELLRTAFRTWRSQRRAEQTAEFEAFCVGQHYWLADYTLYMALREEQGDRGWVQWPQPLRDRDPVALTSARTRLAESIEFHGFLQFVFYQQWRDLRAYAHQKGVLMFGDVPIFVAHDSADVWAHRELFLLDADGHPTVVAGVPPDYFSATGQRWGNPLYNWDALKAQGFQWWIDRFRTQLHLFDLIRVDHFRGFEAYWEINAGCPTAVEGRWVKAPGEELFATVLRALGSLPLVAEDLGIITSEVVALRERFGLPGMKILQFAFDGGAENAYLPHNHEANSVVYTGTHDNDTTCGWFTALPITARERVNDYLGSSTHAVPWSLIRAALMSVARLAVVPMQDFLELDGSYRMNTPGTAQGNWAWRFAWPQVTPQCAEKVRQLAQMYGRT
jgi:4-alpha-glucanotransferase